MHSVIDVPHNVSEFASRLKMAGVSVVVRYYNHRNSNSFPSKCLARDEFDALNDAGLAVAVVFQQRGGAGGNISDFESGAGARDASRALQLATGVGQPENSAIYFAVDWDYYKSADLAKLKAYFEQVKSTLSGRYKLGVYGSGTVADTLSGIVDYVWLAGAVGWSGTREALAANRWSLFQKHLELHSEIGGFGYDGNIVNPSNADFGQFSDKAVLATPRGIGNATLYMVVASSGLNLRSGPGETFSVLKNYPNGTLVTGQGRDGDWIKVDINGDGTVDGYMHGEFLRAVSGGLPVMNGAAAPKSAIAIAEEELALGVSEVAGSQHNPRIVMYHATTSGGSASDETAWCSSFANYCVERAGLIGTDSKWARSWHDGSWGRDVSSSPQRGDIVVFSRVGAGDNGGHVGFYLSDDATSVEVLGGNQSNRVCIARYPKNGRLGPYEYKLLSIRRY